MAKDKSKRKAARAAAQATATVAAHPTVTLGDRKVVLKVPRSLSVRYELLTAANGNAMRGMGACLGACWASAGGRPKASYAGTGFNPMLYGAAVLDELLEAGLSINAIVDAADVALRLIADSLPNLEGVEATEGFTEPSLGA